jgi:cyclic-di-GMP-binding protein
MNFELPSTGTEKPPAFVDAAGCQDWLGTVPMANAVQAQSMFLQQLNLLHRFTLPPTERFAILETLREPVCTVQEDAGKKFAGKPLPFAPHEQAALESTLSVWHAMGIGYLQCFDALSCGDTGVFSTPVLVAQRAQIVSHPELAARAAKLAQRTLSVFADWQVDLCRGEQLPDSLFWKKLHEIFSAAETLGIATRAVTDHVRHGVAHTSALATYAECHLVSTANVYELPARHLAWVVRWAKRWGPKIVLLKAPPEDIRNRAVPLWVDIESDSPASYVPCPAQGSRWLETTELRRSLVARITLLAQGREPAELQLGDDVTQPAATQLLQRVLQRWCKGGAPRRHERHAANADCSFIAGFESVHYHLSGRQVFRAPTRSDTALRREREEFETFGNHGNRTESTAEKGDSHVEFWHLVDESAGGMRLTRPLKEGARIGAGLLIAVKAADSQRFTLGNVRWALREGDNSLAAGIQLLPGEARPVAVRVVEPGQTGNLPWRQAFLLPAIAAINESASVVVPAGTFRLDRSIEVMVDEKLQMLKLFRVLDRGIEFERCNFYD